MLSYSFAAYTDKNGTSNVIRTSGDIKVNGGIIEASHRGYALYYESSDLVGSVVDGYTLLVTAADPEIAECTAIQAGGKLTVNNGIVMASGRIDSTTPDHRSPAITASLFVDSTDPGDCTRWFEPSGTNHDPGCMSNGQSYYDHEWSDYVILAKELHMGSAAPADDYFDSSVLLSAPYASYTDGLNRQLYLKNAVLTTKSIELDSFATDMNISDLTLYTEKYATLSNFASDTCVFSSATTLMGDFDGELYTGELLIATDTTIGENALVEAGKITVTEGVTLTINGKVKSLGKIELAKEANILVNGRLTVASHFKNEHAFKLQEDAYISGNNEGLISICTDYGKGITETKGEAARIYGMADVDNDLVDDYYWDASWTSIRRDIILSVYERSEDEEYHRAEAKFYYNSPVAAIRTGYYPVWVGGDRVVFSQNHSDGWVRSEKGSWTNASYTDSSSTDGYYEEFVYHGTKFGDASDTNVLFYPQTADLPAKLVLENAKITDTNIVGPEEDYFEFSYSICSSAGSYWYNYPDMINSAVANIYSNNPIDIQYSGENEIGLRGHHSTESNSFVTSGIYSVFSVAVHSDPLATDTNMIRIWGLENRSDMYFGSYYGYSDGLNLLLSSGVFGYNVELGKPLEATEASYASYSDIDSYSDIIIESPDLDPFGYAWESIYSPERLTAGIFSIKDTLSVNEDVTITAGTAGTSSEPINGASYGIFSMNNVGVGYLDSFAVTANTPNGVSNGIYLFDEMYVTDVNHFKVEAGNTAILGVEESTANAIFFDNVRNAEILADNGILFEEYMEIEKSNIDVAAANQGGIGIDTDSLCIDYDTEDFASHSNINVTSGDRGKGYIGIKANVIELYNYAELNVDTYKSRFANQDPLDYTKFSYGILLIPEEYYFYGYSDEEEYGVQTYGHSKLNINTSNEAKNNPSDFGVFDLKYVVEVVSPTNSYVCSDESSRITINAESTGILADEAVAYDNSKTVVRVVSKNEGENTPLTESTGIWARFILVSGTNAKLDVTSKETPAIECAWEMYALGTAEINATGYDYGIYGMDVGSYENAVIKGTSKAENGIGIDAEYILVSDTSKVYGTAKKSGGIGVSVYELQIAGNNEAEHINDFFMNKYYAVLSGEGASIGVNATAFAIDHFNHFSKIVAKGGEYGMQVVSPSDMSDGYLYAHGNIAAVHTTSDSDFSFRLGSGYKLVKTYDELPDYFDTIQNMTTEQKIFRATGTDNTMGLDYESYEKFVSGTDLMCIASSDTSAKYALIYFPMEVNVIKVRGHDYDNCTSGEGSYYGGIVTLPYNELDDTVFFTGEICNWIKGFEGHDYSIDKVGAHTGYDWYNKYYGDALDIRGDYEIEMIKFGDAEEKNVLGEDWDGDRFKGQSTGAKYQDRFKWYVLKFATNTNEVITSPVDLTADVWSLAVGESKTDKGITLYRTSDTDWAVVLDNVTIDLDHYTTDINVGAALKLPKGNVRLYVSGTNYIMTSNTNAAFGIGQATATDVDNNVVIDGNDRAILKVTGSSNVFCTYGAIISDEDKEVEVESATQTDMAIVDGATADFNEATDVISLSSGTNGQFKAEGVPVKTMKLQVLDSNTVRVTELISNGTYDTSHRMEIQEDGTGTWTITVNPLGANNKNIILTVDNESVATVTSKSFNETTGKWTVKIKALGDVGDTAKITAKAADNKYGAKTECNIKIKAKTQTVSGGGGFISAPSTYTVTFNANGHGKNPQSVNVASGGKVSMPTAPTAEGFVFGGWYEDKACTSPYNFDSGVKANITLYAKWTEEIPEFDLAAALSKVQLRASTEYTSKKNTRVTVSVVSGKDSLQEIKDQGYKVSYKFYRSTKAKSDYKARVTKTENVYLNNEGVLGKKYYYKARLIIKDKNGNILGQTELTQCYYGERTFKGEVEE